MIAGIYHQGSGLGNQLHRYVGTRVLALDRGQKHAMVATELFKGKSFMQLDMVDAGLGWQCQQPSGKVTLNDLKDVTVVDAEFQSEADFIHRLDEIREWLKVEPLELPDDLCIISHRGGEYTLYPDLYLKDEYWEKAIGMMRTINRDMKFEVQTDDYVSARLQFPSFQIVQNMSHNWRSVRFAKHLILSNSSFSILPSLINEHVKGIIAPEFHAGHNKGYWQEPNNRYKRYTYI